MAIRALFAAILLFAVSTAPAQAASIGTGDCETRFAGMLGTVSKERLADAIDRATGVEPPSSGAAMFAAMLTTTHDLMKRNFAEVIVLKRQIESLQRFQAGADALSPDAAKGVQVLINGMSARATRELDAGNRARAFIQQQTRLLCGLVASRQPSRPAPPPPKAPPAPPPPKTPPRIDLGSSAVLEMEGEPVAGKAQNDWKTVEPGRIVLNAGTPYGAEYTWEPELPQSIDARGFDLKLHVSCRAAQGQRVNTGIGIKGGFDLIIGDDDTPAVASTARECHADNGKADDDVTVHIKPQKGFTVGQKVTIEVWAFYGPSVVYTYKVVRAGR